MKKIVTIIGARPQFIKAAAVSRVMQKTKLLNEIIIHTGQHFDDNMSEIFFREMEIPKPTYNLNINGLSHGAMTGQMLEGIERILMQEKPDWVMVYGDTNSTLAGALAASKLHIKVAHVEAGLRSFNYKMPEEINRILTDRISTILFVPTDSAIKNLEAEGYKNFPTLIIKNGDVMQDAAMYYAKTSEQHSKIISQLGLEKFVLATLHREENTNDINVLQRLLNALNKINAEIPVVVPLHPRTKKILTQHNLKAEFKIIDPVGYFDMIEMLKHCSLVMTDSGGLQKEAFFFQKHCITLREQTEWVELVEHDFNKVVGSDEEKIKNAFEYFRNKKSDFNINLYGNGIASEIIVETLLKN
ncbi:UDP-2,3-diacetamido-2,3-dideoxy-D-glucuronate 2-epimerase [Bacteroidota bacterium]|nr:UDP-2,3-diacetamido-2,3-dideoxy-D-glucuronate 2-epimerase [Bacteroidota bacterium]